MWSYHLISDIPHHKKKMPFLSAKIRYYETCLGSFPSAVKQLPCLNQPYNDVIRGAIASQITRLTIVYSTVYLGADQTKHRSSASLAFEREIHRWPVNSPHKWPVTRKIFPFDDIIMLMLYSTLSDKIIPNGWRYLANLARLYMALYLHDSFVYVVH